MPAQTGKHTGYFRLQAPGAVRFGPRVWLEVISSGAAASPVVQMKSEVAGVKPEIKPESPTVTSPAATAKVADSPSGYVSLPTASVSYPVPLFSKPEPTYTKVTSSSPSMMYAAPSSNPTAFATHVVSTSTAQSSQVASLAPSAAPVSAPAVSAPASPYGPDEIYPEQLAALANFGFDDVDKLRELVGLFSLRSIYLLFISEVIYFISRFIHFFLI